MNESKKIKVVAKRTLLKNLKSKWYVLILIIPILIGYLLVKKEDFKMIIFFGFDKFKINQMISLSIPILACFFCFIYSAVIANEIVNDKTSKIMDLLFSMSSARIQLVGKIQGIYVLLLIQLITYFVGLSLILYFKFNIIIFQKISGIDILYLTISIIVATFFGLIWSTTFATYINDNSQTGLAILPVCLLYTQIAGIAFLFALTPGKMPINFARIILDLLSIIPGIGSIIMPVLIYAQNLSWVEGATSIVGQSLIGMWLLKRSIKKYGNCIGKRN